MKWLARTAAGGDESFLLSPDRPWYFPCMALAARETRWRHRKPAHLSGQHIAAVGIANVMRWSSERRLIMAVTRLTLRNVGRRRRASAVGTSSRYIPSCSAVMAAGRARLWREGDAGAMPMPNK